MDETVDLNLFSHFAILPDPRKSCLHRLSDILVIVICAVLCGADSWMAIEAFGKAQRKWFRSFLTLEHGIPSHDTFGRVFALLDTKALTRCFLSWTSALAGSLNGKQLAVDGKSLRHSFDHAAEKAMIHMVNAWVVDNAMVLGQLPTEAKSNEITAVPKLLRMLELKGCLVSLDAMGCQRAIAKQIVDQGGDYLMGLKDNHPKLHAEVIELFDYAVNPPEAATDEQDESDEDTGDSAPATPPNMTSHHTAEKGHGRHEERTVYCIDDLSLLSEKKGWKGLSSVAMVYSKRTVGEKVSEEWRYYISSCKAPSAEQMSGSIRRHWSVENELHYVLDVSYREDDCRIRIKNAAANLSIIRQLTLNLIKQDRSKGSVRIKRQRAGWDETFRRKLLGL